MKLDSVRAFKKELSDEVVAAAGESPEAVSFFSASNAPMPPAVALGVALKAGAASGDADHYVVAVRTDDPAAAEAIRSRANGEADVKIITVSKRTTPAFLQGTVDPLEPGAQVGMAGKNFVGTLGALVRDRLRPEILYILSNSHVLADEGTAFPGHRICQPHGGSRTVALLDRFVPFSRTTPNLVDCAIARLSKVSMIGGGFNAAIQARIAGLGTVSPSDLGAEVAKIGRTTGVTRPAKITAAEVDGLPVGMDAFTPRFDDQFEISGGSAFDFSKGGDSGSLIIRLSDKRAIGLLFAGGASGGEDFTYANRLENVLNALGVELVL